ncbi:MAG: hypothetical protein VKL42_03645 [Snowella sp.]|nr:hypothetical protein [Snowella sp.]
MNRFTANYDESWKEALSEYFDDFLAFFFTEIYQQIDWTKTPQSLDKELQQITASSETDKCIADKLYQVWLLDSQEIWILIHIEVQSQYDTEFSQRMYVYNYRAFDLYQKPVLSLAILGDERFNWRPTHFRYGFAGSEVTIKFSIVKLLDYQSHWSELESSLNPFAMIVMAHLKTKATTGNPEQREVWKWSLIRGLYERGLTRERIIKLFQIIDRMMTLPRFLQESLDFKIQQFEEERTMPLLSNMELRGMERGKEIGKEIGALQKARDYIKAVLRVRLGEVPLEIETYLTQISDLSILDKLLILAATTNSFEAFRQSME